MTKLHRRCAAAAVAAALALVGADLWLCRDAADARQRGRDLGAESEQFRAGQEKAARELDALEAGNAVLRKEHDAALARLADLKKQSNTEKDLARLQKELQGQLYEIELQRVAGANAHLEALAKYSAAKNAPAAAADKLAQAETAWQVERGKILQNIALAQEDVGFFYYQHTLRSAIKLLDKGSLPPAGIYLAMCPDEHRGWEWEVVHRPFLPPLHSTNLGGPLGRAAFTPDGKGVAVSWKGQAVKIVQALTGKEVSSVPAAGSCLAVSESGLLAAPAPGEETQVALWELATGQKKHVLKGHTNAVTCLAFGADGRLLAGAQDGSVRAWDVASGDEKQVFAGTGVAVLALAPRPGSTWLAAARGDQVVLMDTKTGKAIKGGVLPHQGAAALAFTPDGKHLASAGADKAVRVWGFGDDKKTLHAVAVLNHPIAVGDVAYLPDGKYLITATADGAVHAWDVPAVKAVRSHKGHAGLVRGLAVRPDGRLLITAGQDGIVRGRDFAPPSMRTVLPAHDGAAQCVAISPDGKRLATGGADKVVKLWRPYESAPPMTLAGHTLSVERVLFAPGGDWLVSLGLDQQAKVAAEVKVWDAHTGKLTHSFVGPAGPHTDIAFNRSPTVFAVTAPDTPIALYDADKGQQPNLYGPYWGGPAMAVPGPKLSHRADLDGGFIALTATGSEVWETRWPDKQHTGPGKTQQVVKGALPVTGLQLAPRNNRILVLRPKIGLDIWTVPAKPAPYSLVNRFAPVQSPRQVAIHPDGTSWALALGEPSITVWHFPPGARHKKVLNFEGVKATITAVAFSPTGHALAATDTAGNLLLWESSLPEFALVGKK